MQSGFLPPSPDAQGLLWIKSGGSKVSWVLAMPDPSNESMGETRERFWYMSVQTPCVPSFTRTGILG